MLAYLSHLLRHSSTPLGDVVHIGAGVGRELEIYNSMNFSGIVAIEADPILFDKLIRKSKRFKHVHVKNVWVAPKTGEVSVYCFANPRFNSLLAPNQLTTHFSNLNQCEQKSSMAEGINDVIEDLPALDSDKINILVLDVNGAEVGLINECTKANLNQFDWVIVRASQEPLYTGSALANELVKTLTEYDLTLRFADDEHEPFIEHYYQRDKNTIKIKQLESSLIDSQRDNSKLNARFEEVEQANTQSKKDINDLTVRLEDLTSNSALREKALEEEKALVINLKDQITQLSESSKKLEIENSELSESVENHKQAIQSHQEEAKVAAIEAKLLREEKQTLIEQNEAQNQTIQTLQEKLKKTEDAINVLQEEKQSLIKQNDVQNQTVQTLQEKVKQGEEAVKQLQAEQHSLVEQVEAQKQSKRESLESKDAKVSELNAELTKTQKQLEQQTQWHHQNKDRVENLNKQLSELKQQLIERQKACDMAIKLQTKAQVDLEDLREKYKSKNYNELQLVELVKELRVKLNQAAEFYHYLENNHPELAELDYAETKDSLVKTPKSKRSTKKS